ncbi:uncharacterized protein BP01DRAFT_173028 [Aspergillus saccharolyticus JOP 1030-1]|uniref:Uncharacterized protein n=1 Tax=Aspergillus saccharolyticus JOP 1030-1 TaxID=1450539 RepID=A0A318Z4G0_9EURO|nr:hypothetical protein BP01DRAFT_173028 [Aspergillus saccharolyticus JOP 1030-1]PYH41304.1 hypothetical protein BP01DRAFT_173028 [Aspergillus saccharolyticus JOP 1030-1]
MSHLTAQGLSHAIAISPTSAMLTSTAISSGYCSAAEDTQLRVCPCRPTNGYAWTYSLRIFSKSTAVRCWHSCLLSQQGRGITGYTSLNTRRSRMVGCRSDRIGPRLLLFRAWAGDIGACKNGHPYGLEAHAMDVMDSRFGESPFVSKYPSSLLPAAIKLQQKSTAYDLYLILIQSFASNDTTTPFCRPESPRTNHRRGVATESTEMPQQMPEAGGGFPPLDRGSSSKCDPLFRTSIHSSTQRPPWLRT